jgi:hypothetical protein
MPEILAEDQTVFEKEPLEVLVKRRAKKPINIKAKCMTIL